MPQFLQYPKPTRKLTPEELRKQDEQAKAEQSKYSAPWKLFEGLIAGLMSGDPGDVPLKQKGFGDYGQGIGALLQGAIPFPAGKRIFHGSRQAGKIAKEGFDMNLNDPDDTLGWMIHAAKDPNYANDYSGVSKSYPYVNAAYDKQREGAGILPMTSNATKMFDAYNPEAEDIARLVSGVTGNKDRFGRDKRQVLIDAWKQKRLKVTRDEPIRDIVNYLSPEEFNKTGFDAIRYPDLNNESYAFPDPSKLQTAYGNEPIGGLGLNIDRTPIPLEGGKGVLMYPTSKAKKEIVKSQFTPKQPLKKMPWDDHTDPNEDLGLLDGPIPHPDEDVYPVKPGLKYSTKPEPKLTKSGIPHATQPNQFVAEKEWHKPVSKEHLEELRDAGYYVANMEIMLDKAKGKKIPIQGKTWTQLQISINDAQKSGK